MKPTRVSLYGPALAALLVAGCNNGPPGGGITNGPAPDLTADKQAVRTDLPERSRIDVGGEMGGIAGVEGSAKATTGAAGNAPTSGTAAGSPTAGVGISSGSGGKGNAPGGNAPATDPAPRTGADRKDTVTAVGEASSQPPPTKDSQAGGSAAGATKPQGSIKVGTPTGPQ